MRYKQHTSTKAEVRSQRTNALRARLDEARQLKSNVGPKPFTSVDDLMESSKPRGTLVPMMGKMVIDSGWKDPA
jgi:hypothetical protein